MSFPVFIPCKGNIAKFCSNFTEGLKHGLQIYGIPDNLIQNILDDLGTPLFCKTNNRSVLGSMNDLTKILTVCYEYKTAHFDYPFCLEQVKLLSRTPMSFLDCNSPQSAVLQLLNIDTKDYESKF
jgi:hypothetical protein